jgi:phosphonate degradation associated HDIG domain protein
MTGIALDQLLAPLRLAGMQHYGEDVSQYAHAVQCAALAQAAGAAPALVAAALLHDIGQLLNAAGDTAARDGIDAGHEQLGADFLARWFGTAVCEPVRLHVAAKRYLCAVDPAYKAGLSAASMLSLGVQGGPMCAAEQAEFVAGQHFADAVALRRWDDAAKVPGWQAPPLNHWLPLLASLSANSDQE